MKWAEWTHWTFLLMKQAKWAHWAFLLMKRAPKAFLLLFSPIPSVFPQPRGWEPLRPVQCSRMTLTPQISPISSVQVSFLQRSSSSSRFCCSINYSHSTFHSSHSTKSPILPQSLPQQPISPTKEQCGPLSSESDLPLPSVVSPQSSPTDHQAQALRCLPDGRAAVGSIGLPGCACLSDAFPVSYPL